MLQRPPTLKMQKNKGKAPPLNQEQVDQKVRFMTYEYPLQERMQHKYHNISFLFRGEGEMKITCITAL